MNETLPRWANRQPDGSVHVDVAIAYPLYLDDLGLKPTAFNTGVVKVCITRDLATMYGVDTIRFKGDKAKWSADALAVDDPKHNDHDAGMRAGGKFRARLLAARAKNSALPE